MGARMDKVIGTLRNELERWRARRAEAQQEIGKLEKAIKLLKEPGSEDGSGGSSGDGGRANGVNVPRGALTAAIVEYAKQYDGEGFGAKDIEEMIAGSGMVEEWAGARPTRASIAQSIHNLVKKGRLERVEAGLYRRARDGGAIG